MYAAIYGMVDNVVTITSNSVQAALGQIFNSDKQRFLKLQEAFETYYFGISIFFCLQLQRFLHCHS